MPGQHREPVWIRAHRFVLLRAQPEHTGAGLVLALAEEVVLADEPVTLELPDPLVHGTEEPSATLAWLLAAGTVALLGNAHLRFALLSIRTAPAAGVSELVCPSSQRTR